MSDDSRLQGKIKCQITRFASRLTDGWAKPLRRFVGEMLYGLQAAEDVKVSNIARSLAEKVRLIKTENRLRDRRSVGGKCRSSGTLPVRMPFCKGLYATIPTLCLMHHGTISASMSRRSMLYGGWREASGTTFMASSIIATV